jgi:hypothetical protein
MQRSQINEKKLAQKSELPSFFIAPTGKSVGSEFVTPLEPTDLPVGVKMKVISFQFLRQPHY